MRTRPLLLTPGPLTTAASTRRALGNDWGSREAGFIAMTAEVRSRVVELVTSGDEFVCVPLQESGTFAMEATLGTFVPREGRLLVCINGAYGRRLVEIARAIARDVVSLIGAETQPIDPVRLAETLRGDPGITHVAVVHCETTTGIENPLEALASVTRKAGRRLLVDAMSAHGALPIDAAHLGLDAVVGSANKCLEGVPGLALVVARTAALEGAAGNAHSLSLDLHG